MLYQSASGTTASTAAGTAGYVLTSNGTSAPTFQSTSAAIYNPANVAITGGTINGITALGVAGDVTITGANALRGSYGGGGVTTNFASGDGALYSNTVGSQNTALGVGALNPNTSGSQNTANGSNALAGNITGSYNTVSGQAALYSNTTGSYNTVNGYEAGYTATPANANVSGSNNTWIGYQAGPGVATQLDNATALGNGALNTASNQVVLGNSAVTSNVIYGGLTLNNNLLFSATAPTIASGFGISPTVTFSNGTAAFYVDVGSGGAASTGTINMNVIATHYWSCAVTYDNDDVVTGKETIYSQISNQIVGFTNITRSTGAATPWVANDVFFVNCVAM